MHKTLELCLRFDLNSGSKGCARLGGEVALPLGVVIEEVAVLIVLVRRHRRAVGAAVRRAVDDEVPEVQFFHFGANRGFIFSAGNMDLSHQAPEGSHRGTCHL